MHLVSCRASLCLVIALQRMFGHLALSYEQCYRPLGFWKAFKDYDGEPINVREHQDAYEFFTRLQVRRAHALLAYSCKFTDARLAPLATCPHDGLLQCSAMCLTACKSVPGHPLHAVIDKWHTRVQRLWVSWLQACLKHSRGTMRDAASVRCAGPGGPAPARAQGDAGHAGGHGRHLCAADHLQIRALPLREGGGLLPGASDSLSRGTHGHAEACLRTGHMSCMQHQMLMAGWCGTHE